MNFFLKTVLLWSLALCAWAQNSGMYFPEEDKLHKRKPAEDVSRADLERLDTVIDSWILGGKVCQKEKDRVWGTRIFRQPCIEGDSIPPKIWKEIYDARRVLVEKIEANERKAQAAASASR